jgi:hypothetical protein
VGLAVAYCGFYLAGEIHVHVFKLSDYRLTRVAPLFGKVQAKGLALLCGSASFFLLLSGDSRPIKLRHH